MQVVLVGDLVFVVLIMGYRLDSVRALVLFPGSVPRTHMANGL